jgi:hypothetical protein
MPQQAATQERGDLERVQLVVPGLPAMDGLHRERVSEHEYETPGGADIRQPVPREHAFRRHDEIITVRCDDLEEGRRVASTFWYTSTWPVASRIQTYMVFTWRSIPQW